MNVTVVADLLVRAGETDHSSLIAQLRSTGSKVIAAPVYDLSSEVQEGTTWFTQLAESGLIGNGGATVFCHTSSLDVILSLPYHLRRKYHGALMVRAGVELQRLDIQQSLHGHWLNVNWTSLVPDSWQTYSPNPAAPADMFDGSIYAAYAVDAAYTVALAFHDVAYTQGLRVTPDRLVAAMFAASFEGVSGDVRFDSNGDRSFDVVCANIIILPDPDDTLGPADRHEQVHTPPALPVPPPPPPGAPRARARGTFFLAPAQIPCMYVCLF